MPGSAGRCQLAHLLGFSVAIDGPDVGLGQRLGSCSGPRPATRSRARAACAPRRRHRTDPWLQAAAAIAAGHFEEAPSCTPRSACCRTRRSPACRRPSGCSPPATRPKPMPSCSKRWPSTARSTQPLPPRGRRSGRRIGLADPRRSSSRLFWSDGGPTFPPRDAWPRGTGRHGRRRPVTAEAVARAFAHVTGGGRGRVGMGGDPRGVGGATCKIAG